MGRILSVDMGAKRVGLAISDPLQVIASPLTTISYRSLNDLIEQLSRHIKEHKVERIVVGYPLGMKGQTTQQTEKVNKFISLLSKHFSIPTDKVDERLSSVEAIRTIQRKGYKPSKNKTMIDGTAAAIFLQTYLDRQSSL